MQASEGVSNSNGSVQTFRYCVKCFPLTTSKPRACKLMQTDGVCGVRFLLKIKTETQKRITGHLYIFQNALKIFT